MDRRRYTQIVREAQSGNRRELAEWLELACALASSYLNGQPADVCQDLRQECRIAAWQTLGRVDPEHNPVGYLGTVVHRTVYAYLAKETKRGIRGAPAGLRLYETPEDDETPQQPTETTPLDVSLLREEAAEIRQDAQDETQELREAGAGKWALIAAHARLQVVPDPDAPLEWLSLHPEDQERCDRLRQRIGEAR